MKRRKRRGGRRIDAPFNLDGLSRVEKAKLLKNVRDGTGSTVQLPDIMNSLTPADDHNALVRTVRGLSVEDDFALQTRLMGRCSHYTRLDQTPITKGDYIRADAMLTIAPRFNVDERQRFKLPVLVEVKSTTKEVLKVSKNDLKRRRNFADAFGLPLFFAVKLLSDKFPTLWAIVADDRKKESLRVQVGSYVTGIRNVFWDDYFLFLHPRVRAFQAVYDTEVKADGVLHPTHGTQVALHILIGKELEPIGIPSEQEFLMGLFFETFRLAEVTTKSTGTTTRQLLVPQLRAVSLLDAVWGMNGRVLEDAFSSDGDGFSSRLLALSDQPESSPTLLDRDRLEALIAPLLDNDYLGILDIGERAGALDLLRSKVRA